MASVTWCSCCIILLWNSCRKQTKGILWVYLWGQCWRTKSCYCVIDLVTDLKDETFLRYVSKREAVNGLKRVKWLEKGTMTRECAVMSGSQEIHPALHQWFLALLKARVYPNIVADHAFTCVPIFWWLIQCTMLQSSNYPHFGMWWSERLAPYSRKSAGTVWYYSNQVNSILFI